MTIQELLSESRTTIIFIVAALVIVIGYFSIKRYREVVLPKKRLENNNYDRSIKSVKRIVEAYVRRNDGRLIYAIEIGSNRTKGSADIILIGYFGVLVLVTCDLAGEIYANEKDAKLTQIVGDQRRSHENPILKVNTATKAVAELLREKRVYKVPVEGRVVFTGKKANINVPRSLNVSTLKELTALLKTNKYLDDKKVDVDKATNALLGMASKPEKKS